MANPTGNVRLKGAAAGTIVLGNTAANYSSLKLKSVSLKRTAEKLDIKGDDAQTKIRAWYDLGHEVDFTAYAKSDTVLPDPGDDLVFATLTFDVDTAEFQSEESGPKLLKITASKKDGMAT